MLRSPILFREIVTTFRKYRTFAAHAIFLVVMAAVMFVLLPGVASVDDPSQFPAMGREIYVWLAWLELVLIACAAPAAAAATITMEKERNTLDLLLITDLTRFEIGFGKFFSRLYNLFVMVMLSVPMLAILLTIGGISGEEVMQVIYQVLGLGVLALGLGFFFSVVVRKSYTAIVMSYVVMAIYAGAAWKLVDSGVLGTRAAISFSPIHDFAYVLDPRTFGEVRSVGWIFNPTMNLLLGFGMALLGSYLLPYASTLERVFSLRWVQTKTRKAGTSRPLTKNPIYWLESSSTPFGRVRLGWPSYALGVVVLLGVTWLASKLGWLTETDPNSGAEVARADFYYWAFSALNFLLVIIATVRAATSVVVQRENRSQMLLATTPVDEATYLGGLIFGLTRSLLFLLIIPLGYVTFLVFAGYLGIVPHFLKFWAIPYAAVVLTSMLAFYVVQGICISFLVKSSIRAVVFAVVAVVVEMVAPLAMCCCAFPINPVIIARAMPAVVDSPEMTSYNIQGFMIPLIIAASLVAQVVYCLVLYSVMKSGFDRYLDRNI